MWACRSGVAKLYLLSSSRYRRCRVLRTMSHINWNISTACLPGQTGSTRTHCPGGCSRFDHLHILFHLDTPLHRPGPGEPSRSRSTASVCRWTHTAHTRTQSKVKGVYVENPLLTSASRTSVSTTKLWLCQRCSSVSLHCLTHNTSFLHFWKRIFNNIKVGQTQWCFILSDFHSHLSRMHVKRKQFIFGLTLVRAAEGL